MLFSDGLVSGSPIRGFLHQVPIFRPEKISETRPDYVLILPWNIKDEIMHQMSYIQEWGGQFVVPIPEVTIYPAHSAKPIAAPAHAL